MNRVTGGGGIYTVCAHQLCAQMISAFIPCLDHDEVGENEPGNPFQCKDITRFKINNDRIPQP